MSVHVPSDGEARVMIATFIHYHLCPQRCTAKKTCVNMSHDAHIDESTMKILRSVQGLQNAAEVSRGHLFNHIKEREKQKEDESVVTQL